MDHASRPSYLSTFPLALGISALFWATGFTLDWITGSLDIAIEDNWPDKAISQAVVLPLMMLLLKYFGPRQKAK